MFEDLCTREQRLDIPTMTIPELFNCIVYAWFVYSIIKGLITIIL